MRSQSVRVEWTVRAIEAVYDIIDHIAIDSPTAAVAVAKAIRDQTAQLADFPQLAGPDGCGGQGSW